LLGGLAVFALWLFVGLPLLVHPPETEYLFGLSAHGWIAFWTFALTVVTGVLAWVAWYQIGAAREEAEKNRTILACERYDTDSILDRCCQKLAAARDTGDLVASPKSYRVEIFTILNYLESIAIGVEGGFYVKDIVKSYMEPIFRGYVEEYIESGLVKKADILDDAKPEDYYEKVVALCKSWTEPTRG
jgi:hypothetical protein